MGIRMVRQALCDRCGTVISTEDDEAGQIDVNDMTDDWQIAGGCKPIGDLCGKCIAALRVWIKSPPVPAPKERTVEE